MASLLAVKKSSFLLPGAEHFSRYLEKCFGHDLTSELIDSNNNSLHGFEDTWGLFLRGEIIGKYIVEFSGRKIFYDRIYDGIIEGYRNPGIQRAKRRYNICLNEDRVVLLYYCNVGCDHKESKLTRGDVHNSISFPENRIYPSRKKYIRAIK